MTRTRFLLAATVLATLPFLSCSKSEDEGKLSVGFLLKSKGNQYFVTCEKGARAAAEELDIDLRVDGPISADPAKQNEIVENWITDGLDVIVAACENKDSISTALRKAQEAGIKVVTYDAELKLNGLLGLADPLLGLSFNRIGDRAATGLVRALDGKKVEEPTS